MSNTFMRVDEVAEELGISKSYAYKIVQRLNLELKNMGYLTVTGRVSKQYFNYITNLQGDVIEISDGSNNVVGSYVYNAYGKIESMSGTMAAINPLRYRGYYYDTETRFYYLNSRYYDPEIGRFINADNQIQTGSDLNGMNMFTYCGNNPVNRVDPTGEAWWHWAIGLR